MWPCAHAALAGHVGPPLDSEPAGLSRRSFKNTLRTTAHAHTHTHTNTHTLHTHTHTHTHDTTTTTHAPTHPPGLCVFLCQVEQPWLGKRGCDSLRRPCTELLKYLTTGGTSEPLPPATVGEGAGGCAFLCVSALS